MTDEKHVCPYGAEQVRGIARQDGDPFVMDVCGECGWLCERCREDRADERMRALIHALAGIASSVEDNPGLSNQSFRDARKEMEMPT